MRNDRDAPEYTTCHCGNNTMTHLMAGGCCLVCDCDSHALDHHQRMREFCKWCINKKGALDARAHSQ